MKRPVGLAILAMAAFGVGTAFGADMPVKAPAFKATAATFDWSGLYAGVYLGTGIQQSRGDDPTGGRAGGLDYTGAGFNGGVTLGYNVQVMPHWIAGIEGDFGALSLGRDVLDWNDSFVYNSKASWLATIRGRVGYSSGPTFSYVTGGAAFVSVKDDLRYNNGSVGLESSKTRSGYAYGTGVETMLGGNWTVKAESLYVDVGKGDAQLLPGSVYDVQVDHRYSVMKFGLNYLFGGHAQGPLPANNWGGFYAGLVGGGAVVDARGTQPGVPGAIGDNDGGFTLGGLAGYNWQFTPHLVAGVEGDFSWLGIDRSLGQYNDFQGGRNAMLGVKTNWLATLRGRFGYSTGPALIYATGGGAWVNVRDDWQGANGAVAGPAVSSTKTLSGYTVGAGIETPFFFDNWTSRTEYLYVDAGSGDTLASTASMTVDHRFHLFRTSLTYQFGAR